MKTDSLVKALKSPPDSSLPKLRWRLKWWIEEHEPIWLGRIRYTVSRFYWDHIRCVFLPQNRWATDAIGRTWQDKVTIIPNVLFAAIIHYVEGEKCFETIVIEEPTASKIREIYAWAKTGRQAAQERMETLWNPGKLKMAEDGSASFEGETGDFNAYNDAEREIEERDTEYLTWIVANRGMLWT